MLGRLSRLYQPVRTKTLRQKVKVYSGSFNSSAYNYVGYEGWLYTSTPNSATNRYRLLYQNGSANLNNNNRNNGMTIRCVASS